MSRDTAICHESLFHEVEVACSSPAFVVDALV